MDKRIAQNYRQSYHVGTSEVSGSLAYLVEADALIGTTYNTGYGTV